MTLIKKIKPCPFCGYEYAHIERRYASGEYFIECANCGACSPIGRTEEEAIELWETRHVCDQA